MNPGAKGRARLVVVTAGILLALAARPAGAQLTITPVTVGDLGVTTLDGSSKTLTAPIDDFTVTDSRLIASGWNVSVSATVFQQYDPLLGYVPGGPTLPAGSLRMEQPSVERSDPPTITPGPYLIDGATIKIASASLLTPEGSYVFTQGGPLQLTVPASAYATTFRSTVSVSVATGP